MSPVLPEVVQTCLSILSSRKRGPPTFLNQRNSSFKDDESSPGICACGWYARVALLAVGLSPVQLLRALSPHACATAQDAEPTSR